MPPVLSHLSQPVDWNRGGKSNELDGGEKEAKSEKDTKKRV